MGLSKLQREAVRLKYGNKCAYCGCELEKSWHADHLSAIERNYKYNRAKSRFDLDGCKFPDNNRFDNYMPSCASCNIQKSSLTLEQFREKIAQFMNSLNLYSNQYKFAKKYRLVRETGRKVEFYFETLNTKA
jgi:hypothetical protein